jgi:riboflavin biosynthesis pyrimidine reductase
MRQLHPFVREVTAEDLFDVYDVPGPHLRVGFVASVDGVIAVDGTSSALSSPADKAVFRALRTVADAVIVGAGTARDEDYGPVKHSGPAASWRAAHGFKPLTTVVVVSRRGEIDAASRFLEGPALVAVPEGVSAPGTVIRTVDPVELVKALHARGLTRLLCEGGPSLLTSFLSAGVVDELCLTTAAVAAGEGPHLLGSLTPQGLSLTSLVYDDPGVLLARWAVVRS